MEVNQYLLKTINLYEAEKKGEKRTKCVHVVIGNESCDLDSFVSALTLAWFKHKVGAESSIYIPIMNIRRKALKLRTEIMFMVAKLGINIDCLMFNDEINWDFLTSSKEKFKLTLVDHNCLPKHLLFLDPYVVEIVDHHPVATEIRHEILQNIKTIGSCSSLVAAQILENIDFSSLPDEIKMMLISSILIDTCNFDPSVGKTTESDVEVFEKLKSGKGADVIVKYYDQLNSAKFDVQGLTITDIMLKDPKYLENSSQKLLFSTIHQTAEDFFRRSNVAKTVSDFCKSNDYAAWLSLSPVARDCANTPYKPIAIHSSDTRLSDEISSQLQSARQLEVAVSDKMPFTDKGFVFLRMYNCKASRKQVLPVVQQVWRTYY